GEKSDKDGPKAGKIIDQGGGRQAEDIARHGTNHDLDQGHRNGRPYRYQGRRKGKSDPHGRREPNIVHRKPLSLPCRSMRRSPTSRGRGRVTAWRKRD